MTFLPCSTVSLIVGLLVLAAAGNRLQAQALADLSKASIIVGEGPLPPAEKVASSILSEEVQKRTGLKWSLSSRAEDVSGGKIFLASKANLPAWKSQIPEEILRAPVLARAEGFCIQVQVSNSGAPLVWIIGSDARGVMFGVGQLLRKMELLAGKATIAGNYYKATSPNKPIRGHQIGYRPRANSWDAWTIEQFDQYFRDMVVFGANSMENIPFQDDGPHPLMKYSREQMNIEFAKLCAKYDLDHWLWVPVEFTVADDAQKSAEFLKQQEAVYSACPRLDAIFVPGGDPGHNASASLLPYLEKMAAVLEKHHPKAKIWLSMQGFKGQDIDDFYDYLAKQNPKWFGGAVMGPSSPPMEVTRQRLPSQYPLRWYPDITHNVRCQYPIPWLDPTWGLTIGREGVNPRPQDFSAIYQNDYRLTDGFLSYTDGIHDDFNKNLWTAMAWDPERSIRETTNEYARYFFRSDMGEIGTAAIFGLEENLRGPAETNGSVQGTLALWQKMESELPDSQRNWRFDMHLFRAYFDAYTHARLIYESKLEADALELLSEAHRVGVEPAMAGALQMLTRAETTRTHVDWLHKAEQLADRLFETIGYQTSVPKYGASGYERGCMMDYINYPLNNRWWIEDQLAMVRQLSDKTEQLKKLQRCVDWENPGPGGYYEAVGHVGKSLHMIKLQNAGDSMRHYYDLPMPTQRNIGPERNKLRMSFHVYHDSLPALKYNALDPKGKYTVKLFSQRESPLEIDGQLAKKILTGEQFEQVIEQEFEVPESALVDGKIELTWAPLDEQHLNWRQRHYVTDIWILRH
jgi:hypothetical protein